MTTEPTGPIADQLSAVQMIESLINDFPNLPDAYITIHQPWRGSPSKLSLQLDTPNCFEQWRAALGIDGDNVALHPYGRDSWVNAQTVRGSIHISISAHGISLTEDQVKAPRDRSEVPA